MKPGRRRGAARLALAVVVVAVAAGCSIPPQTDATVIGPAPDVRTLVPEPLRPAPQTSDDATEPEVLLIPFGDQGMMLRIEGGIVTVLDEQHLIEAELNRAEAAEREEMARMIEEELGLWPTTPPG